MLLLNNGQTLQYCDFESSHRYNCKHFNQITEQLTTFLMFTLQENHLPINAQFYDQSWVVTKSKLN